MSYVLAIDVGTSFTAAAIAKNDLGAQSVPESLPLGLRGTSVPSVVYYPEEGPLLIGEAAERRGLDDPGRVVREFKRRIGDSVPLAVGTLLLQAEDIFATMAHWVVGRAAEREGAPPSEIIITHPAAWGGHRTSTVLAALAARGLHNVTLISEPEAAALYYASQVRVDDGSTIAVYDLGGGTFDTAILRKGGGGHFDLLGSPDGIEGLGGADFDAEVLRHVAAHTGDALAAIDPEDPGALAALARLKRECVEAKEALSADSEANIAVFLPGAQQQVRLVRSEFEAMIDEPIRETVDALERSLEQLGLEPDDLTAVLLIGGSSRIPLVAQLISAQLDRPIAVDADPKSSICLGAAVAALRAAPAPVTGPAEPAGPARVAGPLETAGGIPEIPVPTDIAFEPHGDVRRASWSRKSGAAVGSLAGTAALAGDGARGFRSGHAGSESAGSGQAGAGGAPAGRAHGAKSGSHAPRPAIRLTAVAAGAALFTILTATAAGSPEGLGSLTAMFAPPAAPADAAPGGTTSGAASPGGTPMAGIGIEASAKPADAPFTSAGLEASAAPTGKPSPSSAAPAPAAVATTGGPAAGHAGPGPAPDGPGTSGAPTEVAAPGTLPPTTPATVPPSETQPPVTDPPATTAPTPEPTPPPTTATPTPDLTPPPTPGPTPTPSLEPVPTTQPQPTATETTAPAPQAIQTSASADPTTVPGG